MSVYTMRKIRFEIKKIREKEREDDNQDEQETIRVSVFICLFVSYRILFVVHRWKCQFFESFDQC